MSSKPVSMKMIQLQKKERVANYYIDQLFIASHFNTEEYHSAHKMTQYTMDVKPKSSITTKISTPKQNSPPVANDQVTMPELQDYINNQQRPETEIVTLPSSEEKIQDPPSSDKIKCRSSRGIDITHYLVQGKY